MPSLPEQLRAARRERKLSQKALGARLGLPQSHVSAIEGGKVDPRLSSVLQLARLLDLEPMLVPRAQVPAVRALLAGTSDEPLWQAGEDEESDAENDADGS